MLSRLLRIAQKRRQRSPNKRDFSKLVYRFKPTDPLSVIQRPHDQTRSQPFVHVNMWIALASQQTLDGLRLWPLSSGRYHASMCI